MANSDLTAILDGLTAAVILVDAGRRIVFANPAAAEWLGTGLDGQNIVRAVRHPDCLAAVDEVLAGARRADAVIVLEMPVRHTLKVSVTGLAAGNPFGARAAVCFEDISHVFAARQMRSDFVANVSHELRTPLTSLAGFIETLQGPARDDEAARDRFLGLMEGEARRMNRLIADLLSLAQVEAKERVRPLANVAIASLVQGVIKVLGKLAERERKTIRLTVPEPDPAPAVRGDEHELAQVFQNLLENALKYGAPGTAVEVSVRRLDRAAGIQGPAIAIAVADQGEGIERHHIPRLTERFYRVDAGRSRDKGGTGLGLAIVSHIVSRHRGQLHIDSVKGKGSTFTVTLPAA